MSGRVGCAGRKIRSGREHSGRRDFNSSNNLYKRQELKFYPHRPRPDRQMATFTKLKGCPILKIQSLFVNGSDITAPIHKGLILD